MPIFSAGSASVSVLTEKFCVGCSQGLPLGAFCRRVQSRDGLNRICRDCAAAYKRDLRDRDPLYEKRRTLWRFYKITLEQYNDLLAKQGGVCAICGVEPEPGRFLPVDHDHRCCPGKVTCGACIRGLLCSSCNIGMGCFGDDLARMARALDYLKMGGSV